MSASLSSKGYFDYSINAYFDGTNWNRRNSSYGSWILGMYNTSDNNGGVEFVHWPTTGGFERPFVVTPNYVKLGNTSGGYDMRLSTSSFSDTYGYSALKVTNDGSSSSYPNARIIVDSVVGSGVNSGFEMWVGGVMQGRLTASTNTAYAVVLDARNAAATSSSYMRFRFSTGNTERFRFRGDGVGYADSSWTTFSPYLSYNYTEEGKTKTDYELGQVVSLREEDRWTVTQSNVLQSVPYGVVVVPEGFTSIPKELKDEVWEDEEALESMPNVVPVAHLGEASTMVRILPGEEIKTGDPISVTSLSGVGGKATGAGEILGRALEPTSLWGQNSCPMVSSIDAINWPEDDGSNPTKPCYRLPDGSIVGKIMIFVNVTWYDPKPAELLDRIEEVESQLETIETGDFSMLGVMSDIEAAINNTYDLGSVDKRWKDIYVGGTLNLGGEDYNGGIKYNPETKKLEISNDGETWIPLGSSTNTELLSAQYPGSVVLDGTDNNTGEMTMNNTVIGNTSMNYYQWESTESNLNSKEVSISYQLPSNFKEWGSGGITLNLATESADTAQNSVNMYVYEQNSISYDGTSEDNISVASGEWTTTKIEGSQLDMCNEAEKVCIIKIQMSSSLEKYVRIGDIKIKYERTL
jgi:hypothetical protein